MLVPLGHPLQSSRIYDYLSLRHVLITEGSNRKIDQQNVWEP